MQINFLSKRLKFGNTTIGKLLSFLVNLIVIVVIAIGASMLVKTFFIRSFYIPSESMKPTLEINDNILVSRLVPGFMPVVRGDIIVFKDTQNWMETQPTAKQPTLLETISSVIMLSEPADSKYLVKRVIAVPGDEVKCCDAEGYLTINGQTLKEPYLTKTTAPSEIDFNVKVPEGKVWVMGDNRVNSSDSRYHQDINGGFINQEDIIGKAFVRTLPFSRMSGL